MNYSMLKLLILKDWYLQRWAILGSLAAGAAALGISVSAGQAGLYIGVTLVVTVLIAIGVMLVMSTIVLERKEQTICFVMSLPISPTEYSVAKLLANLLIFLVPWTAIVGGSIMLILTRAWLPHGLVPYVSVMSAEILFSTCLVCAVALMTESQAWTIAAMMVGNLGFNVFAYFVARIHGIAASINGAKVVWSQASVTILMAEFAAVVALLSLTLWVQSRKTDFI